MKLLLVEDDIEMSELLTEILNKENNYRNLIFSLLTFPQRAELILDSNQQLLDTGLIQMIDRVATRMAANSSTEAASFLQNVAAQLRVNYATANRVVDNIYQAELKLPDLRQLAKKVKRLGESSQKISQVVNLINSFADRTNLLALNAFLEANRAGQEGQNFAIVAEEVQTMARQSAEATTEIEKLVASIQLNTKEVVAAMEQGTEQVAAGTKLVDETRQKLNQIADSSNLVGDCLRKITVETVQQSIVSQEMSDTIAEVATMANVTSTDANEVSSSTRELLNITDELQTSAKKFKV